MVTNKTLLLIFVTLASVTAQTFQYSRGWTNGKRDGHRREELREISPRDIPRDMTRDIPARDISRDIPARDIARGISASLEKIITPCQMNKLKYILEGKTLYNELLYMPCDTMEDDSDSPKQRYKLERNQDPLLDVFQ